MKTGKLPEHTFKRSVLNPIQYRSKDVIFRAAVGHDGAVIGDMVTAIATTAFYYEGNEIYALENALNNVIAAGGRPCGIMAAIMLPEHSDERLLRGITGRISKKAKEYELDIYGGHTELVPTVSKPTITVTAYGKPLWRARHKEVNAGMDVVMTKWAGLYGGSIIARLKFEELATKYPRSYIKKAEGYFEHISLMPELKALEGYVAECGSDNIYAAHDVSNGGVFGALWQIFSACNTGAVCNLSEIPMKQEIIEVCEYFDINPYMLNGTGSLILVAKEGEKLVEIFEKAGITSAIIGKISEGADRKVSLGDEERFLVPPRGDALNVVFYGQKMQP